MNALIELVLFILMDVVVIFGAALYICVVLGVVLIFPIWVILTLIGKYEERRKR